MGTIQDSAVLSNILIQQKDQIRNLVNSEEYEKAWFLIDFLAPLWAEANYTYKTQELREYIRNEIRFKIVQAEQHKTEEKWRSLYNTLQAA